MRGPALAAVLLIASGMPGAVRADTPPVEAVPTPPEIEELTEPDAGEQAAQRLGLRVDEGQPIDISADELEALRDADGAERVIFTGNVRVVQGSLRITADRLEAVYPRGAGGRPGRIEATQNVRIAQDGAEARCNDAVFEERVGRITCSAPDGAATLRRGGDVVRGDRIEFDLRKGVLKVRGRARVSIQPRKPEGEETPSTPVVPEPETPAGTSG